jgi:hypothetical protein
MFFTWNNNWRWTHAHYIYTVYIYTDKSFWCYTRKSLHSLHLVFRFSCSHRAFPNEQSLHRSFLYICIYIYIYIYMCEFVYIYVCMYIYKALPTLQSLHWPFLCINNYIYMYIFILTHTPICMYLFLCSQNELLPHSLHSALLLLCSQTYTYIHIYT